MDKLNVCLLNDSFPPTIDGVANVVQNYADIIQRKHGNAVVVTPKYPNVTDEYPYQVIRYPSAPTSPSISYRVGYPFDPVVLKKLGDIGPDIIHSHCPVASTLLARTLREKIDVPLIFTYHTKFDIDIRRTLPIKKLQDKAIRAIAANISACDDVWVVSRGAGENLRSIGYEGEYTVMENGVDFPKGRSPEEQIQALRKELGADRDTMLFLFVGRMLWYKGLKIILEGLKMLKEQGKHFKMIFVGDGSDRDEVEKSAVELGLGGDCIFTGAIYDREKLRIYFSACDLFLFPSTFDTNGIVVREAAACEMPSVIIRNSCASEGIDHLENGVLIDENAASLAAGVAPLCDNRDLLRKLGKQAQNDLYISWEEAVAKAFDRYNLIIDKYKTGEISQKEHDYDELFTSAANICTEARLMAEKGEALGYRAASWYKNILRKFGFKGE